jgi:cyclophilin family peptidyl-prolyl cis-trans isomerase
MARSKRTREGKEKQKFGPIALERTSVTGQKHIDGAISMGRTTPDSALQVFSFAWAISLRACA